MDLASYGIIRVFTLLEHSLYWLCIRTCTGCVWPLVNFLSYVRNIERMYFRVIHDFNNIITVVLKDIHKTSFKFAFKDGFGTGINV